MIFAVVDLSKIMRNFSFQQLLSNMASSEDYGSDSDDEMIACQVWQNFIKFV